MATVMAVLAFIFSPIGRVLAIGTIMFLLGWNVHSHFSGAREKDALITAKNARIRELQTQLTVSRKASGDDQQRALDAEEQRKLAQDQADDLEQDVPDNVCTDSDVTGRSVRELWRAGPRRKKG